MPSGPPPIRHRTPNDLPETRWTLINRSISSRTSIRRHGLGELLEQYRGPMADYLRRRMGLPEDRAEDIVHDFIHAKILERRWLQRVDRGRGRFRAFLVTSLVNFARSELRKSGARPVPQPADRDAAINDPVDRRADDPSARFDRDWALNLLHEALDRMRVACEAGDQHATWAIFHDRLVAPALHQADPRPYEELIREHRLDSPTQATNLMVTAKRAFRRHLREAMAAYTAPGELDEELHQLIAALSAPGRD